MANRLAHALLARGLQRGDRVAIFLPNSIEAVVSIFAVLKAGGVFVMVNHTTKEQKLAYILANCQASALITAGRHQALAARLADEVPSLHTTVLTGAAPEELPTFRKVGNSLRYEQIQEDPAAPPAGRRAPASTATWPA